MTAISATAAARPSSPAPISTSCRPRSASGWPSASASSATDESARHRRITAVEPIELIELVAEDSLGDHDADAIARGRVIEYGRYAIGQRRGIPIMQPLDQAAPFLFLGRIGHDFASSLTLNHPTEPPFRRSATLCAALGKMPSQTANPAAHPPPFNDPTISPSTMRQKSTSILEPTARTSVLSF